jgi:TPR repeat protein
VFHEGGIWLTGGRSAKDLSPAGISREMSLRIVSSCVALCLAGCEEPSFGPAGFDGRFDRQACLEQALRRNPDPTMVETARATMETECHQGSPAACSAFGVMYEVGAGVPTNTKRAVALYEFACRAGNDLGCTNLAVARIDGIGGPPDVALAARLLAPACGRGNARACRYLADLHADPAAEGHLLQVACDGGEALACAELATRDGRDGYAEGATVYDRRACALGDSSACVRLEPRMASSPAPAGSAP